jgi:alginate O-acetyltransferase complex protein AlgI
MLFNSFQFLLFLPLVVCGYYLLPQKFRWVLLLVASYYFYMCWRMEYIILIAGTTLIDFTVGLAISNAQSRTRKLFFLCASLTVNLGLLFTFKYFDFFSASVRAAFEAMNVTLLAPELKLLLPVGISFYTFQSIAYVVEVYRGNVVAERHLGRFAAYISFFPQLVAGPIERPNHLLPQFHQVHKPKYESLVGGLNLIALGFFKKVVIADRCAVYVNEIFANPSQFGAWATAVGVVLFAFQIYCDFSGYSDIAIGSARLMGYDLMQNFDRPYLSRSISEFWRRWHISLSTWFRDYLYVPLGGSKKSRWRNHFNVFVTFVVSGLWHGASWTYVVWGAFHGAILVLEREARGHKNGNTTSFRAPIKATQLPRIALTFVLVCIGWVFFRAKTMEDAFWVFRSLGDFSKGFGSVVIRSGLTENGLLNFVLLAISMGIFFLSGLLPRNLKLRYNLLFLLITSFLILFLGKNSSNEFIYFQF